MATRSPTRPRPASADGANGSRPIGAKPATSSLVTTRRSAPMALVGMAAVVAGALLFLALYTSVDRRQAVLAVARPVAAGQVISAADLRVVRVASSPGVEAVAAAQRSSVVGKTAAVSLVAGGLLSPSQLGAASTLQAGMAVVGMALKPGQAPSSLRAGARVQVVDTIRANQADQSKPIVLSTTAVVSSVAKADNTTSATTLVSLTLSSADAPAVAAAGLDGRLSLVVLPQA